MEEKTFEVKKNNGEVRCVVIARTRREAVEKANKNELFQLVKGKISTKQVRPPGRKK